MNLLPDSRKKQLAQLYLVRVGVVGAILASLVLGIHAVLTTPSLVHVRQVVSERTLTLSALGEQLADGEDKQVGERVARLATSATELTQHAQAATASGVLRALTEVSHEGVSITGMSFTRAQTPDGHRFTITGKATGREALRSYVATLGTLPYVKTVDLPISAYAKESDIQFSLTLIGTLTP
jgi:hypothetical protein